MAHLGVLCALEKAGISIDLIAGTSMGALVGGVYALTGRCDLTIERFRLYLESKEFKKSNLEFLHAHDQPDTPAYNGIFQRFASFIKRGVFYTQSLTKRSPISEENFAQNINFILEDVDIRQTRIPLAVIALDLKSSDEVILREGSLRKAVSASCAIPGILPPVKINNWELVDGGWIDRVPVGPAWKMGADLVIAVDVAEGLEEIEDLSTGLGIVMRTNEISRFALSRLQIKSADVMIRPDIFRVHWSDFSRLDECLKAGEEATLEKLDDIRRSIKRKKWKKIFRLPVAAHPAKI